MSFSMKWWISDSLRPLRARYSKSESSLHLRIRKRDFWRTLELVQFNSTTGKSIADSSLRKVINWNLLLVLRWLSPMLSHGGIPLNVTSNRVVETAFACYISPSIYIICHTWQNIKSNWYSDQRVSSTARTKSFWMSSKVFISWSA